MKSSNHTYCWHANTQSKYHSTLWTDSETISISKHMPPSGPLTWILTTLNTMLKDLFECMAFQIVLETIPTHVIYYTQTIFKVSIMSTPCARSIISRQFLVHNIIDVQPIVKFSPFKHPTLVCNGLIWLNLITEYFIQRFSTYKWLWLSYTEFWMILSWPDSIIQYGISGEISTIFTSPVPS